MHFDKLLIATGGFAVKPIVPGIALKNVFTLRESKDQEAIKQAGAQAKKVVIIGSGFIGVEFASHLKLTKKEDIQVTIVSNSETTYDRALGKEVGSAIQKICEEGGVQFKFKTTVKEIVGKDGAVVGVELTDGTCIEADLVLFGTGIQPATQFIGGQVDLAKDGSIEVNPFL